MVKQQLNEELKRMQQLAGIVNEDYDKLDENHVKDYWSIMVQEQPEDVIKILTDLTTGQTSFDNFITRTNHDVYDSFKDELYDDEDYDDEEPKQGIGLDNLKRAGGNYLSPHIKMDEADKTKPKTKFKKGDEFPYMGSRYTVLSDNGYVVKAKRNKDGYEIMLNYAQLNER